MDARRQLPSIFTLSVIALSFFALFFSFPHDANATVVFLTSGTSWTVPNDWNSAINTIQTIGGGGKGGGGGTNAGGGGGGGGYSAISNLSLTPGASVTISIGPGGAGAGGDTWFNGASLAASSVGAKGGGTPGTSGTGSSGGASASGIGTTKYSGGNGGNGVTTGGGGGGGGAAGPNGAGTGANGGAGSNSSNRFSGGGGGGNGGGSAGGAGTGSTSGVGGNNSSATGGGASVTTVDTVGNVGTSGGGGSGGAGGSATGGTGGAGGAGGAGIDFDASHGSGGGGGGGSADTNGGVGGTAGNYGAGGGGVGKRTASGGNGAPGIIVITYTALVAPTVSTDAATSITLSGATLGGTISSNGGSNATQTGVAYGTVSNLSTVIGTTTLGSFSGTGSFSSAVGSLSPGTTYYFRAYATNSIGTGYGSILNFNTSSAIAPDAPTNLVTTSVTGSVSLSWTAPASSGTYGIASYKIYRDTKAEATTLLFNQTSTTSATYSDSTAVRGVKYFYRITAASTAGDSGYSNERISGANSGRIIRLGGLLHGS